jgi:hypothetical protein
MGSRGYLNRLPYRQRKSGRMKQSHDFHVNQIDNGL